MSWKKAIVVVSLSLFALVFFVVAAAGLLATAAVGAAAVAISESGVVQALEEVADGADRLQIQVDDNSLTITDPDSGKSRTVTSDERFGRVDNGRIDLSLLGQGGQVTVTGPEGESRVIVPELRTIDDITVPQITITDPDSGQSRVIRPNTDYRVPRVVWDGDADWTYYGPEQGLRIVGGFFRGLLNLVALVLIAAGAYLLIRNRRQAEASVDSPEKSV